MNALMIAMTAKSLAEILMAGFVQARFSTEECTILVSKDSTAKVLIENGKAKVFSTANNKNHVNQVAALSAIVL